MQVQLKYNYNSTSLVLLDANAVYVFGETKQPTRKINAQNRAFDNLKKKRSIELLVKSLLKLKQVRSEVYSEYRAIIKHLNVLIEVNGEMAYNNTISQRQGRNDKYLTTQTSEKPKN